jgi:hypothetical protein
MTKWKYLRQTLTGNSIVEFDENLNALGEAGWELVTFIPLPPNVHGYYSTERAVVVLKRPITEPQIL